MRLAAKLLGWKIDIKSEEEKRQEVQNAIEQLSTGAPVSALIEHGLAELTVDALVKADIGTVEKLGSMTPEALEALEGIDAEAVNRIQAAINSFYGQEYAEAPQEEEYGEPIVGGNREDAEAAQPVESQAAEEEPAAEENAVAESDEEAAERAASETPPVSSGTMLELAQSITETDTSGRPADETGPEQNPAA